MKVKGKCNLKCLINNKKCVINFKVIDGHQAPLLSAQTCIEQGLLTINSVKTTIISTDVIEEYSDVFIGLGCIGEYYNIQIKPEIPSVQHVRRRVPVHLKEKNEKKIQKMIIIKLYL